MANFQDKLTSQDDHRQIGRHKLYKPIASLLIGLLAGQPIMATAATPSSGSDDKRQLPKLLVVATGEGFSPQTLARLSYEGERAVRAGGQFQLLDLAQAVDQEGAKARLEKANEAAAALANARKLYNDLDAKAADECDKALQALEKSDLTNNLGVLADAWILRIASLIANGQTKAASAELNLLLPVYPNATFSPNIFAPDFIAQANRKKEELSQRSNLSYRVVADPVPARVYVDGSFRGISPLEIKNLAPGDHFVTLVAPGYKVAQRRGRAGDKVDGANLVAVDRPVLQTFLDTLKQATGPQKRDQVAAAFARELGADEILLLMASKRKPDGASVVQAVRIAAKDGQELSVVGETPLTDTDTGISSSVDALYPGLLKTPSFFGSSWKRKHTGYVIIGLAAAAVGAGFAVKSKNRNAATGIFIGSACLGAAGLFFALGGADRGEAEPAQQK